MQVPKPRPLHPDSLIPSPVPLAHPAQVWPHLFAQRALKQSHHRQEHHACGSALLAGHLLVVFFGVFFFHTSSSRVRDSPKGSCSLLPEDGASWDPAGSTALVPAGSGFVPSVDTQLRGWGWEGENWGRKDGTCRTSEELTQNWLRPVRNGDRREQQAKKIKNNNKKRLF